LYIRYHRPAYGYLIAQIKSPEPTQDILHEIFLKIWEIRGRLELKVSFPAYLFGICRNKAVDFIRSIAADQTLRVALLQQYRTVMHRPPTSQKEWTRMDELEEMALSSLTPQRRAVFELCRKQGKSYQQAAEELGISHQTVKEHMAKALSSLRSFIQRYGDLALVVCASEAFLK